MKLALVGYGRIAPKHLDAFRALGCAFVASCNRSERGRTQARQEAGIENVYADVDSMMASEAVDGVVVCVSIDQIYSVAQALIPFCVPLLIEKPPGTSVEETVALIDAAERHRTPVLVGMNRRHYSVINKAIDDAGGLEQISAVFVEWSEDARYFLDQRGMSHKQVERMVFGNSLHGLDLITFLAGDVLHPTLHGRNLGAHFRWLMALQGVSARGVLVTFNSTWDAPGRWRLTFCAQDRRYVFAPLETCQVHERGIKTVRSIEPDERDRQFKPGFYAQAQAFIETIRDKRVLRGPGLREVLPSMRMAEALTNACLKA